MTTNEWGRFHDPDTTAGMQRYADEGFAVHEPPEVRGMPEEQQYRVAQECGNLLVRVYNGKYPLSIDDADELSASVRSGQTHLFTVTDRRENLAAMAAVVDHPNKLGGDVRLSELGRAAADPASTISARALLKNRVPWAQEHTQADMLYSVTRSAGDHIGGLPSGKGVQSVWWGSRRRESHIPFVTTTCGYDYKLGGVEPFNGFTIPTDPEAWLIAAAEQPVFVPHEKAGIMLRTILEEGTNGRLQPNLVVASARASAKELSYREIVAGEPVATDKFVVTNVSNSLVERGQKEVDDELADSISQKVTIEFDVASTPEGAAAMRELERQGWTLCGWTPSELVYGGVCPVYTRINPAMVDQLVGPGLHPANFDEGGLSGTHRVLETMYTRMFEQAVSLAPDTQKSTVVV